MTNKTFDIIQELMHLETRPFKQGQTVLKFSPEGNTIIY
jgi:hypothetical protein